MLRFASTFVTGFEEVIRPAIERRIGAISSVKRYNGLIIYSYQGAVDRVAGLDMTNNSFVCIREFAGKSITVELMANKIVNSAALLPRWKTSAQKPATFRVRFSVANRFVSVSPALVRNIEKKIIHETGLLPDRVKPDTEFWFVLRNEGIGFFGQLLPSATSRSPIQKGEIKPEFAALMGEWARVPKGSVVLDPFLGYGGIAKSVYHRFAPQKLYLSDIDPGKVLAVKRKMGTRASQIVYATCDARSLSHIKSASICCIITDPPWGYYDAIDDISAFYADMMREFMRVLAADGKMVLLIAQKEVFETLLHRMGISYAQKSDVLVNGKKAALYCIEKTPNTANKEAGYRVILEKTDREW